MTLTKINNKLVVVLGMHRSGTSAITRSLQTVGIDLGDHLMPPVYGDNDKGFWEDLDIVEFNIEILNAIGSQWHSFKPLDEADLIMLRSKGFIVRAVRLLHKKLSVQTFFGFKDPRTAKVLAFWKEVFAAGHFDVSYVLALRNPLSVARSLAKRDGFDPEKSYLLWSDHVISSLVQTRGKKILVVDYDQLMQEPLIQVKRIAEFLETEIDVKKFEIYQHEFLDEGLRHTVYKSNDLLIDHKVLPLVQEVYSVLLRLATDSVSLEHHKLVERIDAWQTELHRMGPVLRLADKFQAKIIDLNSRVAEQNAIKDRQDKVISEREAERDAAINERDAAINERDAAIAHRTFIINTCSWRLTRPLRFLARLIRHGLSNEDRQRLSQALSYRYQQMPLPPSVKKKGGILFNKWFETATQPFNDLNVKKIHWSIDSLIYRNGTYYGFGWIFHEEEEIKDLKLKLYFKNGKVQTIIPEFGKVRGDVAARFPNFSNALHSGYMLLGSCEKGSHQVIGLSIHGKLGGSFDFDLNIPRASVMCLEEDHKSFDRFFFRQFFVFFKRGLHLLRQRQFAAFLEKGMRYLKGRPQSLLTDTETVQKKLTASERQSVVLVIDHDLGGGANLYRELLLSEKIEAGNTIFVLSFHVITLSYILIIKNDRLNDRFAIPGYSLLFDLGEHVKFKEIIYNTAVSFNHPERIPQFIVDFKQKYNVMLIVFVHDFFIVCPSHFLLNSDGNFCRVPDVSECTVCLPNNNHGFSALYQERDLVQWRFLWNNVVRIADEIVTFSNDTLKLIKSAYPMLDLSRAVVRPHEIRHMQFCPVKPTHTASLRIGVVGHIGYHKGAKVVQKLAREIKNRKLELQIAIIGAIEVQCEKSVVQVTGPYQHDQLPVLIENSGANIMLFPSICPETFSYVVQELIELELPVACFDLGAPVERILGYAKGLILKESEPSHLLDELISFHKRIYLEN